MCDRQKFVSYLSNVVKLGLYGVMVDVNKGNQIVELCSVLYMKAANIFTFVVAVL